MERFLNDRLNRVEPLFGKPHRPIRTRMQLDQPEALKRYGGIVFAEKFVRRCSAKRLLISDFARTGAFHSCSSNEEQPYRAKLIKFCIALQREQLHYENWDGTRRR